MRTALVTGAAGFIGFHLSQLPLEQGWRVVGVDNHNDYYDPQLKADREAQLIANPNYRCVIGAVEEPGLLMDLFAAEQPEAVVHLAAQAGVRYSIENPRAYLMSNLCGTYEILEAARKHTPKHLLIASTSSAYGANTEMPYRETMKCDTPMSFYAATKRSGELMAHSYAHLYNIPTTMFRFFTVYGPWGRPDMAPALFTSAVLEDRPIKVFNHGDMSRDFTYVVDLVRAISLLIDAVPGQEKVCDADSLSPVAPHRVVNIGNGSPVQLMDFIGAIEHSTGKIAEKEFLPMQPADVPATWADTTLLEALTQYAPTTTVTDGVDAYVRWYRSYFNK